MSGRKVTVESARSRLARHLRALRAERGLSQEGLADLAELHRTYVGSIERCERNVSLDNVERLARALAVDISDLLSAS
ncbi:MAG TPA: helix-turn-helix transcriptional regulator [Methylibium sp.]|uniref:helix-turn-helix transcriptional regulator n=1 Tax=Methylibium sp. TaxID=2067992 RepID=UPI002DBE5419|nr:helix-turn-helix transcriptional regulator [Methylibium sp.]HEU4459741.1 helix-turn-helix transcriptional regulator [Methylibium sp.]